MPYLETPADVLRKPVGANWKINPSHPLNQGLVAWWLMNEGAGIEVNSIGSNNPGTISGATWEMGGNGSALNFDGNDYVGLGNAPSLRILGPITICARLKVNVFPAFPGYINSIVGKGYDGTNEGFYLKFSNVGGTVYAYCGCYSAIDYNTIWAVSGWLTGEWHDLIGLYDGNAWRIYFDGVQVASTNNGTGAIATTKPVYIGSTDTGTIGRFLNGTISQVQIYNYGLPTTMCWALHHNPYGTPSNPRLI